MTSSKTRITQWIVTWSLLGFATGFALTFGDTGHLPASWILLIVPIGGGMAGFIAAVGFGWVSYLLRNTIRPGTLAKMVAGVFTGADSAFLIGWFVLGVQWQYALIWGAGAGMISVVVGLRLKAGAEGT